MPGSPIQAVFFDLDGTLLDHSGAARAGALGLRTRYRDRLTDCGERLAQRWEDLTEHHFGRYLRGETSLLDQRRARVRGLFDVAASAMPDSEADEIYAVYCEVYDRSLGPFSDVSATLEALSSLQLGVITNGGSVHQRRKLEVAGLLDRFSAVVVSEEVGVAKPGPEIFETACQAVGEPPSACLLVGDRLDVDAIGARDAGLKGVWLDRRNEGGGPANITRIARPTELPALVSES